MDEGLKAAFANYWGILEPMSLGEEEVRRRAAEVGKAAGFDGPNYAALIAELWK